MSRVVVTGLGCKTPLGHSVRESWKNLLESKSGIVPVADFAANEPEFNSVSLPARVTVGRIPQGLREPEGLITDQDRRRCANFTRLALLATHEALKDARLLNDDNLTVIPEINLDKFGCIIGSGIGSIQDICSATQSLYNDGKKVSPMFVPRMLANMAAGNVSIKFKLKGASHCVSTACATGNNAIGDAYNFIRLGMQDICVAGASESCISPLSLAGFIRAKSIDSENGVSRPFDSKRSGFVLGEGAGIVVLESLESAKRRQVPILAEVKGYGLSSDAYHITSPSPDGDGARRAMKMALDQAKTSSSAIGYVNAHATSTLLGDRAESVAIKSTFLHERTAPLYVSSNKGSMGHLLGAAGAVESIFTIMTLREKTVPHTLNLETVAGGKGDDFERDFSGIEYVKATPQQVGDLQFAMCNSFGFGGVNTALLFEKWQE